MKRNPKQILKGILLSAIASMFGTNANAEGVATQNLNGNDDNEAKDLESNSNRLFKNVLKMSPSGNVASVDAHRSHSSHSSHRSGSYVRSHSSHTSHTSHSSSSTGYGTSRSTRTNTTPTIPTRTTSNSSSTRGNNSPSTTTSNLYSATQRLEASSTKLGGRILALNVFGNDVNELVRLLEANYYIRENWVAKQDSFMIYDVHVEEAVKHFQTDAKLSVTGKIGPSELASLKAWNKEKTTASLGVRDLFYNEESQIYGTDVSELVDSLNSSGIIIESTEINRKNNQVLFTERIKSAVIQYQLNKGLPQTGYVDENLVKCIKEGK